MALPALIDTTSHARCSASAAERWMNCAGSLNLAQATGQEGTASFAAAQGTFAHAIAAQCLRRSEQQAAEINARDFLGRKAVIDGHAVECDQEMVDGVQLYLDTVRGLALEHSVVELSLTPALSAWDKDLGGTADWASHSPKQRLLRVTDFKYGAGTYVSVEDNKQLKVYALGVLLSLTVPVDVVEVYIVQPRYEGAEPVRKEVFPAVDLLDFAGDIADAARKTRDPQAGLNPGPWCSKTFCPNARICPALETRQQALMAQEFSSVVPVDIPALGMALAAIPLVKERIKAIEEFAYAQATAGTKIPGFKLVEKRGRRQWTDQNAVIAWAKAKAIEPFVDPELKSPAQLEKGLKKGEKAELAAFTATVSSGTALVPESDERAPVSNRITADDFTAIGGPEVAATPNLTAANLFD